MIPCPICSQPLRTWYQLYDQIVKTECANVQCIAYGLTGKGEFVRESQEHFAGLCVWKQAKRKAA